MNIIAKLSFWIQRPKTQANKSIIAKLSLKQVQPFEESIKDAFAQFRREGFVEKLKSSITSEYLPYNKEELPQFLSNQVVYI